MGKKRPRCMFMHNEDIMRPKQADAFTTSISLYECEKVHYKMTTSLNLATYVRASIKLLYLAVSREHKETEIKELFDAYMKFEKLQNAELTGQKRSNSTIRLPESLNDNLIFLCQFLYADASKVTRFACKYADLNLRRWYFE